MIAKTDLLNREGPPWIYAQYVVLLLKVIHNLLTNRNVWYRIYHMKFGELVKNLRIERKLTLRQFCVEINVDPSNWSKIERGVSPAPKSKDVLSQWADYFDLVDDGRQQFMDLADLSRAEIPHDMASNELVMAAMPAFFRAARGHKLSDDKLSEMIEDVRLLHSPDKK